MLKNGVKWAMRTQGLAPENFYMLRSNRKDSKSDAFEKVFNTEILRKNSLLDFSRAYFVWQTLENMKSLNGEYAECGTFRGGTAYLMLHQTNAPLHVFDTFEGMPDMMTEHDTHKIGDFKTTSYEHVDRLLAATGKDYTLHKGFFEDRCGAVADRTFKFAYIDFDIYTSVMQATEFFYSRMEKGGFIIYDDYGWSTTVGAQKAALDFFADKPETPIYLPTRQAFIVKQ